MPQGGKGKPDGESPFKTADGRILKLLKSSTSKTLYYNVRSRSARASFIRRRRWTT